MTTFQKHAGAFPAQTHGTAGGGNAALLDLEFLHAPLLLLLELLYKSPRLSALPVVNVALPQHEEERGTGGKPKHNEQNPPHPHAVRLLPQEGLIVLPGEKVTEARFGRLELDQVVVQDQLSHSCHALPHSQHLLCFVDPFRSLSADEVADDVGQGLDARVEILIGGLQVQLCCV